MDRGIEYTFFQRRYVSGQKVHENMLNITNHQGMKTTIRYHLIPVRMAVIKRTTDNKCGECGVKGIALHYCCKCIGAMTMKNNMGFSQNI